MKTYANKSTLSKMQSTKTILAKASTGRRYLAKLALLIKWQFLTISNSSGLNSFLIIIIKYNCKFSPNKDQDVMTVTIYYDQLKDRFGIVDKNNTLIEFGQALELHFAEIFALKEFNTPDADLECIIFECSPPNEQCRTRVVNKLGATAGIRKTTRRAFKNNSTRREHEQTVAKIERGMHPSQIFAAHTERLTNNTIYVKGTHGRYLFQEVRNEDGTTEFHALGVANKSNEQNLAAFAQAM